MKKIVPIIPVLLLVFAVPVLSQIPTGTWRDHLPYSHAKKLALFDNRIFCATYDGSLFSYNNADQTIKKHSKVNGLSDADVSTIGTSEALNLFFIGYSNGNIDLVKGDSIINISDIKRKQINGGKSINNVFFTGNYAYLSCDFGIVLCDLNRKEIKDTYIFGPNGTQIKVYEVTSDNLYLYAATDQGIYRALLDEPNLLDFNAWKKVTNLPDPDAAYKQIVWFNNRFYTLHENAGIKDVVVFNDQSWNMWGGDFADDYAFIGQQSGVLYVCSSNKTRIYDANEELLNELVTYYAQYFLTDSNHMMWYAALFGGLAMINDQGQGAVFVPEGPSHRDAADIECVSGNVWVGGGTFNAQWAGYGAYSFIDEKWSTYDANTIPALKDFLNISEIAIDPLDIKHIIGGSFGYGIAEFQDGSLVKIEDETGGVLKPVTGYNHGYTRITGTDFDKNGNAFALGSNAETALYKKPQGEADWKAVDLNYEGFDFTVNTGEVLASSIGQIWIALIRHGILVVTEENSKSVQERFFTVKNKEGHIFDNILCLTEDHDGSIWVGTNKGPVYYNDPASIFDDNKVEATQPILPRNDGTDNGSILLSSEQINDIEVDGANRKWIATEKSGAFLVSPDGKKELLHFTSENSPLLSNIVRTIGVNDKTGEVFFGTDKGIVAYRAGATEAGDGFGDVYVFPNPVREDFHGDITITGLARNVNVKITDIAGNLVFETNALGGQAIWNGRNFSGDRVHTGVYMVFCTNDDGTQTYITKLLFIH